MALNQLQFFLDELENYRGVKKTEIIIETIDVLYENPEFSNFVGLTYKENGHLRDTWHAAEEDDKISRPHARLDVQLYYFEKVLEKCKKENKKIYLVMLPLRSNELQSYTESVIKEFDDFFESKTCSNVYYKNYSLDTNFNISPTSKNIEPA